MSRQIVCEVIAMTEERIFEAVNARMREYFTAEGKTWVDISKKKVRSVKDNSEHEAFVISKSLFSGYSDIRIIADVEEPRMEVDEDDRVKFKGLLDQITQAYNAELMIANARDCGWQVEETYDSATHLLHLTVTV